MFAPTRWGLLNTPETLTWSIHGPAQATLIGATSLIEHMTSPATWNATDEASAPFALAWRKMGNTEEKNWWTWLQHDPEQRRHFAHAMENLCGCTICTHRCCGTEELFLSS